MILPDFREAVFLDARATRQDGEEVLAGDVEGLQVFANLGEGTERLYTMTEVRGREVKVGYIEEECKDREEECLRGGSCFQSK